MSSEPSYDRFYFTDQITKTDSTIIPEAQIGGSISGTPGYAYRFLTLATSGDHRLRWYFEMDRSTFNGDSRGYLDDVEITVDSVTADLKDDPVYKGVSFLRFFE